MPINPITGRPIAIGDRIPYPIAGPITITPDELDALDEADRSTANERTYTRSYLDRPALDDHAPRLGRPKLPEGEAKEYTVKCRLDRSQYEWLLRQRHSKGITHALRSIIHACMVADGTATDY